VESDQRLHGVVRPSSVTRSMSRLDRVDSRYHEASVSSIFDRRSDWVAGAESATPQVVLAR
jgi:hypothetical protein